MNVDGDRFVDLLFSHEQRFHRTGWGSTGPQLCWAWDGAVATTDRLFTPWRTLQGPQWTTPTRVGNYATKPLVTQWPCAPEQAMGLMALALAYPDPTHPAQAAIDAWLRPLLHRPGVIGFAYFAEGLSVEGEPSVVQSVVDHINAGRAVDRLHSVDMARSRVVMAVDLEHRFTWILREERAAPQVVNRRQRRGEPIAGAVPRALGLMADTVRGTVPDAAELPVRYPTVGDLWAPTGSPYHERS
jgi:hypothetical protein